MQANERLNRPISDGELTRRWAAIRTRMKAEGIDTLLIQNNNDFMGGYVKYLTDFPATNGYPVTVIFPLSGRMTLIQQGPIDWDQPIEDGSELSSIRRGVGRILGSASFANAAYSVLAEAKLIARALEPYAGSCLGLVGPGSIPYAVVDHLRSTVFSAGKLVDATALVDRIKAEKSAEELEFIRATAAMQDAAMEAVIELIEPGMTDNEVAAIAEAHCRRTGSEQGLYLCSSSPIGEPVLFSNRHLQNRRVRKGDVLHLLIESSGPGGFYTELGRTIILGKATDRMRSEFEFALAARNFVVDKFELGVSCEELWTSFNTFMTRNGRPPENRLFCHGQGYDMVERPLVRMDEPESIPNGLNFACHPTFKSSDSFAWICDNFIFDEGGATRIHSLAQKMFEIT